MRGSGGTQGGVPQFAIGMFLAALGTYLFFHSVRVSSMEHGIISGMGRGRGGLWETTSMGIIFVPLFIGVIALFFDSRMRWAWWVTYLGIGVLAVEILSRARFRFDMNLMHLIGIIVLFCAGVGLMLRSYQPLGGDDSGPDAGGGGDGKPPGT